ncbi:MAG: hypothetical protein IPO85_14795 [Saprospiraceae bacterium]|uniref:Uncharacterized protein n=1 Tax=Candidatus Defluviibacterium haderslevense TaxID=2981993 RepID=A0A9D7XIG7_9BACT|nr:hypothetical protein [Candidatus Defluviibacterium haderslevense]
MRRNEQYIYSECKCRNSTVYLFGQRLQQHKSINVSTAGTYSVTATDTNGCTELQAEH